MPNGHVFSSTRYNKYMEIIFRPSRARQAAYILQNYLLTRRKPFLASFKLTYRCNLRCQQCPFWALESPDPSFEQACPILDQLYQRGDRMVVFEGGEPMLWHDGDHRVHDLLRYSRPRLFSGGVAS